MLHPQNTKATLYGFGTKLGFFSWLTLCGLDCQAIWWHHYCWWWAYANTKKNTSTTHDLETERTKSSGWKNPKTTTASFKSLLLLLGYVLFLRAHGVRDDRWSSSCALELFCFTFWCIHICIYILFLYTILSIV